MMVWSATQNQTFWREKLSGRSEALLSIKLVDVMEFQQNYSNPEVRCHQGFVFIMSANLEDPAMATGL